MGHFGSNLLRRIRTSFDNANRLFDDLIFPVYCVSCKVEGGWLCESCLQQCPVVPLQTCPFCKLPTAYGITCEQDRKLHYLDGVTSRGIYQEWVWRDLIKHWKFGGAVDLGRVVSKLLIEALPQLPHGLYDPVVIPVPLTKRRERWRGFNQADTLAETIAEVVEVDVGRLVIRIRHTHPQPGLGKGQRQQNVQGSFKVVGEVKDRDCVVVDDLLTTGATMDEIAKVLKNAGAKKVWGVTLVRGRLR